MKNALSAPFHRQRGLWLIVTVGLVVTTLPAFARKKPTAPPAPTQVVVTVASAKLDAARVPVVETQEVRVKSNRKPTQVLGWVPMSAQQKTELVILIDDSLQSRSSLQFADLKKFILHLPASTQVAVTYMENGRAVRVSDFSAGHAASANSIRLPSGIIDAGASPYFCLSDLAKHWPDEGKPAAVRQVLMITDGIDRYFSPRQYNSEDPYVERSIQDAQQHHLLVSSIYFRDIGRVDRGTDSAFSGESHLEDVAHGTGGIMYSSGLGNPVTLVPFLNDYARRLGSGYVLTFLGQGSGLQSLQVSTKLHGVKLEAPNMVVTGQQVLPSSK